MQPGHSFLDSMLDSAEAIWSRSPNRLRRMVERSDRFRRSDRSHCSTRGKSRGMPVSCVGCGGKKKRTALFCKKCRFGYLAARRAEAELDDMFMSAVERD